MNERVNLVYGAKVDLMHGWDAPLVPGQPAESGRGRPKPAAEQASQQPSAREKPDAAMVAKATAVVRQR